MHRGLRFMLMLILLGGAGGLVYLHYQQVPKAPTAESHWSYKVKEGKPYPAFTLRRDKYYRFSCSAPLRSIIYGDKRCKVFVSAPDGKDAIDNVYGRYTNNRDVQQFVIKPELAMVITPIFDLSGVFVQDGTIECWESDRPSNWVTLALVPTVKYSEFAFQVDKGMRYDIDRISEPYYVGFFENGKLTQEILISPKNSSTILRSHRDGQEMRFKAAEAMFFLALIDQPWLERLQVHSVSAAGGGGQRAQLREAYYLRSGEEKLTPFWLDEGDQLKVYDSTFPSLHSARDKVTCLTGGSAAQRDTYDSATYNISRSGSVSFRALQDCVLERIVIHHKKNWKIKLRPGESQNIEAGPGDVFSLRSASRYFVNGELLEGGKSYNHKVTSGDKVTFKASVDPQPIEVSVSLRRGF